MIYPQINISFSKIVTAVMFIDTDSAAGLEDAVFDFVIVGGGTTRLIVANRLTEIPDIRVLVLEAGTNRLDDPRVKVPGLATTTYGDPDFDWDFRSVPQVGSAVALSRRMRIGEYS